MIHDEMFELLAAMLKVARDRYIDREDRLAVLKRRYSDDHPEVREASRLFDEAKATLASVRQRYGKRHAFLQEGRDKRRPSEEEFLMDYAGVPHAERKSAKIVRKLDGRIIITCGYFHYTIQPESGITNGYVSSLFEYPIGSYDTVLRELLEKGEAPEQFVYVRATGIARFAVLRPFPTCLVIELMVCGDFGPFGPGHKRLLAYPETPYKFFEDD